MEGQTEPINISVDRDGKVFIQEAEIALDEVVPKLQAIAKNGVEDRIYVRGETKRRLWRRDARDGAHLGRRLQEDRPHHHRGSRRGPAAGTVMP